MTALQTAEEAAAREEHRKQRLRDNEAAARDSSFFRKNTCFLSVVDSEGKPMVQEYKVSTIDADGLSFQVCFSL
eukprot:SAG31_NODE_38083_length_299_cov_0.765000_1_plen_73_part_10